MQSAGQAVPSSKKRLWAGRILSGLLTLFLLFSAAMSFTKLPAVKQGGAHLGYPESLGLAIGILLLTCTALYAIPRTSVLGAILLTGYLGGATASHIRVGDPFYVPILVGVLVWLGLYLREDRLRALIPLRS